uniref:Hepcidin-like n=1 Tax=Acanthochromis polyacanthus TaxID=80966 RepID=A0A3Q1GQG0_9TELE
MKTFSVAVAVAVMLAFIFIQESSAVPVMEQELEDPVSFDNPPAAHEVELVESWKMLLNSRQKRDLKCTPYCYPTKDGVFCGVTCRF